jgi:hypothetical protein
MDAGPARGAWAGSGSIVTPKPSWFGERLRTACVLGRISNLPTIVSNCFAGWLLGGGGGLANFAWLCAGAAMLYTGGMFLNDAVDANWDRQHRPERPIPSGRISRGSVYVGAFGLLAMGWLALLAGGGRTALPGLALVAAIVIYDLVHKQFVFAPVLMAGCRGLLYFTAAAAGAKGITPLALPGALAITGYVAGLSFLARHESTERRTPRWPTLLLLVPVVLALIARPGALAFGTATCAGIVFILWTVWCLRYTVTKRPPDPGYCVSGLLAGIPLADGLAAADGNWLVFASFAGLFLLARGWQRFAPAT